MTADTAIPIGTFTPGSDEWHQMRQHRLGGSEIAAVLGLSPYESHLSLWFRKKGLASPKPSTESMEWGQRLERAVFDKFEENHPHASWFYQPGTYHHISRPWQIATPDGMSESGSALVEVKTTQNEYEWGEPPHGAIPLGYRCQILWNMNILKADHTWLPVLIRGAQYREYLIEYDDTAEADIQILLDAGQKFIQSLLDDVAPPIDGHDETYKTIREQHPEIDPGDVEIPQELADAYIAAVLHEKATKEIRQRYASEIMQTMGRARNAIDSTGQRIAFRKPASNGQRIPFLAVDPALLRSLRPALTIQGGKS